MRLIDADELDNTLFEEIPMAENVSIFHDMIENMPTVYDIDKVVEELKETSEVYCEEYNQREGSLYLLDAIEIVKAGGKNE